MKQLLNFPKYLSNLSVLTWGQFCSLEIFGNDERHFRLSTLGEVLMASRESKPGMVLNTSKFTHAPTTKIYSVSKVNSAFTEKPWPSLHLKNIHNWKLFPCEASHSAIRELCEKTIGRGEAKPVSSAYLPPLCFVGQQIGSPSMSQFFQSWNMAALSHQSPQTYRSIRDALKQVRTKTQQVSCIWTFYL